MAILREKQTWKRGRAPDEPRSVSGLTATEHANVRAAIRALVALVGSYARLALVLGIAKVTIIHAMSRGGKPSAGLALRVARAAYQPAEDVLAGRWPKAGACSKCGRGG